MRPSSTIAGRFPAAERGVRARAGRRPRPGAGSPGSARCECAPHPAAVRPAGDGRPEAPGGIAAAVDHRLGGSREQGRKDRAGVFCLPRAARRGGLRPTRAEPNGPFRRMSSREGPWPWRDAGSSPARSVVRCLRKAISARARARSGIRPGRGAGSGWCGARFPPVGGCLGISPGCRWCPRFRPPGAPRAARWSSPARQPRDIRPAPQPSPAGDAAGGLRRDC